MIDNGQDRISVWEYVNPIAIAKFAYTSPLGAAMYGPYRALAQGRGLMIPGLLPGMGRSVRFTEVGTTAMQTVSKIAGKQAFKAEISTAGRTFGRGLLFGFEGAGAASGSKGMEAMSLARRGMRGWKGYYVNTLSDGKGAASLGAGIDEVMAATLFSRTGPGVTTLGRAGLIKAGSVINPIMNAILVAQAVAFTAETVFKGIRATSDVINRAVEKVYNLELGGELTRGFMTGQAATERQRAMQAIQGSHLSGRRFLGNEAAMVH